MSENRYQKAMNAVCDDRFSVTGAEMLEKAKASADPVHQGDRFIKEGLNMTKNQKTNEKTIIRIVTGITAAAACLGIVGSLGYAIFSMKQKPAQQPAASTAAAVSTQHTEQTAVSTQQTEPTEKVVYDAVTDKLIAEGHAFGIGAEKTDDAVTVKKAILSGDEFFPKLCMDIEVNDAELVSSTNELRIGAIILDEETFNTAKNQYSMWEAFGVQDPEQPNLYHVCMDMPQVFVRSGEDIAVDIQEIHFCNEEARTDIERSVNIEYHFTVPEHLLKAIKSNFVSGTVLRGEKGEYKLRKRMFSLYTTEFGFEFAFPAEAAANKQKDSEEIRREYADDWEQTANNLRLTVDGKEYEPFSVNGGGFVGGNRIEAGEICNISVQFAGVDYEKANEITLTFEGETYMMKKPEPETAANIGEGAKLGMEQSDDLCTVLLDTIGGDGLSPKLTFDVTVKDADLAASNDRIKLSAYILDEENYAACRDLYEKRSGYGERDPEVKNLYHVCMDGPSFFMKDGQKVVIAPAELSFERDVKNQKFNYALDMEYRITIPKGTLKEAYQREYEGIRLSSPNVEYELSYGEFGTSLSLLQFRFTFLGNPLAHGETEYYNVDAAFDDDWHLFAKDFTLTVDGTAYAPQELGYSSIVSEEDGLCSTWMQFPGVDYLKASRITLTAGGQTYSLKGADSQQ